MKKIILLSAFFCTIGVYAQGERQSEYRDGRLWQFYENENLSVAQTRTSVSGLHQIDMIITNHSENKIDFNPNEMMSYSTNKKGKRIFLEVWSSDKYISRIKSNQSLTDLDAMIAKMNNNIAMNQAISKGNATEAANAAMNNVVISDREENIQFQREQDMQAIASNYLKRTTIYPGETISGYILVDRKKAVEVRTLIDIGGVSYVFDWELD